MTLKQLLKIQHLVADKLVIIFNIQIHELFQDVIKLVSIVNKDDSIIRQTELFLT